MEIELLKTFVIATPTIFVATAVYIYILLSISRFYSSFAKYTLVIGLYLIFAIIIAFPLFYLIGKNQLAIRESTYNLMAVLVSYCLIMAPSLYYLSRVKIKELQRAGYFRPRR